MKKLSSVFIAICLLLCLIPSVGMLFFPTTQTTENRAMVSAPALVKEDGSLNRNFFQDFEAYFNQHIALRNEMVYADAMVQTTLFRQSNVDSVIQGSDGWLYYASTLSDYLGQDVMSDRELRNLAHNFSVTRDYLQERGIDFLLTIAPNKNTLYPEHMPYYDNYIVNPMHSAVLLAPYLAENAVPYLDLFQLFEQQEEVLYLKRDSHWNQKGACLVYNHIMDGLDRKHQDYSQSEPVLVKNENGDLNKMLYSFYGQLEENYVYDLPGEYAYADGFTSVEDGWIVTENTSGSGTLLMFRDSFANTLIPFLSEEFRTACYSKGMPNALERYVETYQPDCVVLEKVERNIAEYLNNPPVLTPPEAELPVNITIANTDTSIAAAVCQYDANYYTLSGTVDASRYQSDSQILVEINGHIYRAFHTGENGFVLYLKTADCPENAPTAQVYLLNSDHAVELLSTIVELPQ